MDYEQAVKCYGSKTPSMTICRSLYEHIQTFTKVFRSLEFGSGVSTYAFPADSAHIAVEQDAYLAKKHPGVAVYSPMQADGWYKWNPRESDLFDLILVDGPFRGNRFRALPLLLKIMAPGCTVLVDDTHRDNERKLIEELSAITMQPYKLHTIEGEVRSWCELTIPIPGLE